MTAASLAAKAPRAVFSARRHRSWTRILPFVPLAAFLVIFFALPVAQLLLLSTSDANGTPTLAHYRRLFSSPVYVQVLGTTFWFSAWTTALCIVLGYPLAYLLATSSERRRSQLILWVLLPFWTSFLVRTFAWIVLLGRNGAINGWLKELGLTDAPLALMYNATGVFIGLVHAMLPLAVLTMASVMQGIDRSLVNAGRTLGARGGQAFWRVYFPLSMPGVAAAGILVFVSTIGFFITPALLGGGAETTISQVIIDEINQLNWAFGGAVGVLLLGASLVVFLIYDRVFGLSSIAGASAQAGRSGGFSARLFERLVELFVAGMGRLCDLCQGVTERLRPAWTSRRRLPVARGLLWLVSLAILVFLAGPSFFVIPISFTEASFLEWPPQGFSLRWYEEFFASHLWLSAIGRSLAIGVACAVLAMLIGVPAAFALVRGSMPLRSAALAFALSPLVVPRIIIAVALFYLYARIGLVGTSAGLVLGHTVLALPYVVTTVSAVLKTHDERLEQAARSLGASQARALWHVTLPLIRPGLVAAFLFAFVTSFDEITIALFVTGGLMTTLPKQMWDGALLSVTPVVAAASTITLLLVTGIILFAQRVQRRAMAAPNQGVSS